MEQKIFHGNISPVDFAHGLIARFNRGNYRVQQVNNNDQIVVQIATANYARSGGQTALSISIRPVEDGVIVGIGEQQWLGVAASLGMSAFAALANPMNLFSRLDDIAQDIESLQLKDEAWNVINQTAASIGATMEISERLRRLECGYCGTANPVGQSNCIACGAPLGDVHPVACPKCGYVVPAGSKVCPNCKTVIS
ncbi:MAG: zinc ribbon domain-containing protein [Anaerolineae bacterium]|nr:zinc ribbon domain-containing protein [Anaerolineae bacterium]